MYRMQCRWLMSEPFDWITSLSSQINLIADGEPVADAITAIVAYSFPYSIPNRMFFWKIAKSNQSFRQNPFQHQ